MKIAARATTWIHTHFITDCVYLPADRAREIRRQMARVLEENHIVFGLHFEAPQETTGQSIVLECIPLPETLECIQEALARIIEPIPAKPRATKVEIRPPERGPARGKR